MRMYILSYELCWEYIWICCLAQAGILKVIFCDILFLAPKSTDLCSMHVAFQQILVMKGMDLSKATRYQRFSFGFSFYILTLSIFCLLPYWFFYFNFLKNSWILAWVMISLLICLFHYEWFILGLIIIHVIFMNFLTLAPIKRKKKKPYIYIQTFNSLFINELRLNLFNFWHFSHYNAIFMIYQWIKNTKFVGSSQKEHWLKLNHYEKWDKQRRKRELSP